MRVNLELKNKEWPVNKPVLGKIVRIVKPKDGKVHTPGEYRLASPKEISAIELISLLNKTL